MSQALFDTLAARAATVGYSLVKTAEGFMLRRGDLSVHARGLETIAQLLGTLGAGK